MKLKCLFKLLVPQLLRAAQKGQMQHSVFYTSVFFRISFVSQWDKPSLLPLRMVASPLLPHHPAFLTGKGNAALRFIWNWIAKASSHHLMLCFPPLVFEAGLQNGKAAKGFSPPPEGFRWHSQHSPSSRKGCNTNHISK